MKLNSLGLAVLLMAFAGSALAQTHISGTLSQCAKVETGQPVEVGDHPEHAMFFNKLNSCPVSSSFVIAGLKTTTMTSLVAVDETGAKFRDQGYATFTMENGDKVFARIQGAGTANEKGPPNEDGTWSYTGGTGKLKGIKGKGTYKITPESTQIEGDYSLPDTAKKK